MNNNNNEPRMNNIKFCFNNNIKYNIYYMLN